MLQILLESNEKYSLAEQAQIGIEGGATWLILRCNGLEDSEIRELAHELVPLCRENGTILTFEGRPDMARELGVHGLLLRRDEKPEQMRIDLGPEAIIGAETEDVARILALDKADIDYIAMTTRNPSEIIAEVRKANSTIPFVALGDYSINDAGRLLFAGYNGVCTGRPVFEADDPVQYVKDFLAALS
ncbi:MAG: thiamine phosphate synthase [Muribaculaceae bacterium]|nr:thiamine phosphate synthase [Muribaculaceae bacterium]